MKPSLRTSTLTVLALSSALRAQAQPDVGQAPKAGNPANRAPRALMTPEQRLKALFKAQFTRLGADDATSDLLAAFVGAEYQARQDLTDKAAPLQTALRDEALTDPQLAGLLNTYQGTLEDDKTRHEKAVAALEKAVDLKKMPKIEATLTLMGFIGDGPMNFGGMGGGRRNMMGGAFGGGGFGGGGFGGGGFGGGGFGAGMGGGAFGGFGGGIGQGGRGGNRANRNNPTPPNNVPAQGANL